MAPAFSKEAVLQGSIDHLCLVCESYLRSEREVCAHVSTPEHARNLGSTDYLEKYRDDRVRKVKSSYFCEFCNALIPTRTAVKLHVEEPKHMQNKSSEIIKRKDDVIIFRNIVMQEQTWQGLVDDKSCIICNVEYEDKDVHMNEASHVINLIQRNTIDVNNNYRKIDDFTFHCLTCNEVVAEIVPHLGSTKHKNLLQECIRTHTSLREIQVKQGSKESLHEEITDNKTCTEDGDTAKDVKVEDSIGKVFDTNIVNILHDSDGRPTCNVLDCTMNPLETQIHLNSSQHQNMLREKVEEKWKVKDNKPAEQVEQDILDSIGKFQEEDISIDCGSHTAVCTRCSIKLELNPKLIEEHIQGHKKNTPQNEIGNLTGTDMDASTTTNNNSLCNTPPVYKTQTCDKKQNRSTETAEETNRINSLQKKAEEHDLTYNSSNNKLHCQFCNKYIPSSIKHINKHINEELHKNSMRSSNQFTEMCSLQKLPTVHFIRIMGSYKIDNNKDIVVNEKYCINYYCFTFLNKIKKGLIKCQVCEVSFPRQGMEEHVREVKHITALLEVPVIISTESEFIREIRSGVFQCGFCNMFGSWDWMKNHLVTTVHRRNKRIAMSYLSGYSLMKDKAYVDYKRTNCLYTMLMLHDQFK